MRIKSNKNQKLSNHNKIIMVLSIITGFLIIAAVVGGYFISYIWQVQKNESNIKISTLILQAVDGLSIPAPIEPKSGEVYVPQVRLAFPAMQDTFGGEIEYRYSPAQNDSPEDLSIVNTPEFLSARSTMISAKNLEDTFQVIPKLQACSRGYQLSFRQIIENPNPLKFTKKLSDGRDLYVYLDKDCNQSNEEFESYLKKINSY